MKKNYLFSSFIKWNSSGGALLFAIITSMVMSFTGASLVMLKLNQYRILENEVNRKESYYLLLGGVECINYRLSTGEFSDMLVDDVRNVTDLPSELNRLTIKITRVDPTINPSAYQVDISTTY